MGDISHSESESTPAIQQNQTTTPEASPQTYRPHIVRQKFEGKIANPYRINAGPTIGKPIK